AAARSGRGRTANERAHAATAPRGGSDLLRRAARQYTPRARRAVPPSAPPLARAGSLPARLRRPEQLLPRLQTLVRSLARAVPQPVDRKSDRSSRRLGERRFVIDRRLLALSQRLMRSPDRQVTGVELTFAANSRTFGTDVVVSGNVLFANIGAKNPWSVAISGHHSSDCHIA